MLSLLAALLCVLVNAFFVAAEFAFAKVRPTTLEALAASGDAAAARAHLITRRLDAYLSAMQLGITVASLGLGWLGEPAMRDVLRPLLTAITRDEESASNIAMVVGFVSISGLHIVVGELVPKSLALADAEAVACRASLPLTAFFVMTYPALWVLHRTSRCVVRWCGVEPVEGTETKLSADELRLVLHHGVHDGVDPARVALLSRVLRVTARAVKDVMVPRAQMRVLRLGADERVWWATVREYGFSRYPVSETGGPDGIVGYVYTKDLLRQERSGRKLRVAQLRRDVLTVPDHHSVADALGLLQRASARIAIVTDARGSTVGLLTLEDVLAELLGEVADERGRVKRSVSRRIAADGGVADLRGRGSDPPSAAVPSHRGGVVTDGTHGGSLR